MNRPSNFLRIAVLGGWLISVLMIMPSRAFACSCVMSASATPELATSTAVFAGEVVSIRRGGGFINPPLSTVKVHFKVSEVWKGDVKETAIVETSGSGASCGYDFARGVEYLVYAHGTTSGLTVSLCSRTVPLELASGDLATLGAGQVPPPSAAPSIFATLPVLMGVALLLLVLMLLAVRWLSRRLARGSND